MNIQQETETRRVRLRSAGRATPAGEFEVLAITAGEGNGWTFGEECLRASIALWNGVECFVDHAWWGHSVRDLAGVFGDAQWDAERQGVRCNIKAMGPSGPLLEELGRQLVKEEKPPKVGFSADIVFTSQGKKVEKILRVLSCDLVINPARGGAFLRALNAVNGIAERMEGVNEERAALSSSAGRGNGQANERENGMSEETERGNGAQAGAAAQMQQDVESMRALLDVQKEQAKLQQEAEAARAVRVEMCSYLLESGLAASKLPGPAASRLRKQFSGRVFEPAELNQAIEDSRELVSELTGGQVVQGAGRVHGMYSSEDRLQAAVDDLLGAPREKSMEGQKVEQLQGIRELYMMLTGDFDLHGGYYRERAQLAITSDFSGLVKNALNKVIAERWREMGRAGYDWWKKIVVTEHMTSLNDVT